MSLKQKMQDDLKNAMKSGDTSKRDVLRMIDSMIKNTEIEKKKREEGLSDEEVLEVLKRSLKQRKDSVEQYQKGGRQDLAEKENAEIEIISIYLPEQMKESDVELVVKKKIEEMKAQSKADMGKVMGAVMQELKGKADGDIVRKIVEKNLS